MADPDWMESLLKDAGAKKAQPPTEDSQKAYALLLSILYSLIRAEFPDSKPSDEDEKFAINGGTLAFMLAVCEVAEPFIAALPHSMTASPSDLYGILKGLREKAPKV